MFKSDTKIKTKTFQVHEDLSFTGYLFDSEHPEILHFVHKGRSCELASKIKRHNRKFIKSIHHHEHEHHICEICHEYFHEHLKHKH